MVRNGARHLAQAMDSVLGQDHVPIEYIVIDGGSSDGSVDIIRTRADRLAYWVSERDGGIYDAMNKGLRRATGSIIGILNSDDFYYTPAAVRSVVEADATADADLYHGDEVLIHEYDTFSHFQRMKPSSDLDGMFTRSVLFHPTCFVKRRVYDRIGLFDTRYRVIADYDLLLRAYQAGCTFHYIDAPMVGFRQGGASASLWSIVQNWRMIRERGLASPRTWSLYARSVLRLAMKRSYHLVNPPRHRARRRHWEEGMRG